MTIAALLSALTPMALARVAQDLHEQIESGDLSLNSRALLARYSDVHQALVNLVGEDEAEDFLARAERETRVLPAFEDIVDLVGNLRDNGAFRSQVDDAEAMDGIAAILDEVDPDDADDVSVANAPTDFTTLRGPACPGKTTVRTDDVLPAQQPTALRKFIHLARAWYAESTLRGADYVDQVNIGLYHDDGSSAGEIGITWYKLIGTSPVPRVEVFAGSWHLFSAFRDVFAGFAEMGDHVTPADVCALLAEIGVVDATPLTATESL